MTEPLCTGWVTLTTVGMESIVDKDLFCVD
jgi:hypothetical protein